MSGKTVDMDYIDVGNPIYLPNFAEFISQNNKKGSNGSLSAFQKNSRLWQGCYINYCTSEIANMLID